MAQIPNMHIWKQQRDQQSWKINHISNDKENISNDVENKKSFTNKIRCNTYHMKITKFNQYAANLY